MENKIDYIGQMDILTEEFEKELDNIVNPKVLSELSLEELKTYLNMYLALKDLNDELYKQMEENKEEYNKEEIEMTMDSSRDLSDRINLKIDAFQEQITIKELDIKEQESTYTVSDEVMDLFLSNSAIKAKRKDELKEYSNRELSKEEYDKFIDLVMDTIVNIRYKNSNISSGVIQQNVLFNFNKNPKTDKLKTMLRAYSGRSLTRSEVKALKRHIVDFVSPTIEETIKPQEPAELSNETPIIDNEKPIENIPHEETQPNKENVSEVGGHEDQSEENLPNEETSQEEQSEENLPNEEANQEEQSEENLPNEETNQEEQTQEQVPNQEKVDHSIKGYIDKGILPSNIEESKFVEICNQLGFNPSDFTFELDNSQLDRLKNDKTILIALNNEKIVKSHRKKINDYQELINKYQSIVDSRSRAPYSNEFIARIKENIAVLEKRKREYEAMVSNIKYDSVSNGYDPSGPSITDFKLDYGDGHISRINERLRNEYKKFDDLTEERKKTLSEFERKKIDRKIQKSEDKIKELKDKMGTLVRKQIKIVNENVDKYIDNVQYKQYGYTMRQLAAQDKADKILKYEEEIQGYSQEVDNLDHDLENITGTRISDRMRRFGMNREISKLERKIDSLRRKQGNVDLRYQFSQRISRAR